VSKQTLSDCEYQGFLPCDVNHSSVIFLRLLSHETSDKIQL